MLFTVLPPRSRHHSEKAGTAFLVEDRWNDFGFVTQFWLHVFDADGKRHEVGAVKLGQRGLSVGSPDIPKEFDSLSEKYFSLGQGESYYETLNLLDNSLRDKILLGLRDTAADTGHFRIVRDEPAMRTSLLRDVQAETVVQKLARLARGDAKLTTYRFTYQLPSSPDCESTALAFKVQPHSHPPTNIHILIGRNGVGKTRCLTSMAHSLESSGSDDVGGQFHDAGGKPGKTQFANLVFVSFSAFDASEPIAEPDDHPLPLPYSYIGLKEWKDGVAHTKSTDTLSKEFATSVAKIVGAKAKRWETTLRTLESDPLFGEARISGLTQGADAARTTSKNARKTFERLSSGHKIVLLTITRLVETVDECTLVLVDEPEGHLHPPLLSAFVRALSDLLISRNGVAVLATHSPVVLQEVPKDCVWVLRRSGAVVRAERPTVETFGENVGVLTSEVFGLEVTHSGFHRVIQDAVETLRNYDDVVDSFGGQLGGEARAIVRGLLASRASAASGRDQEP